MKPRFTPDYRPADLVRCVLPARRGAVQLLEESFRQRTQHDEAMAFRYGRSGLYYLLRALGRPGSNVVLPSYTCVVVAHAIVSAGYEPRFVDNAPQALQPTPEALLNAVDRNTAMVIPTHLFGMPQETERLVEKVRQRSPGIFVLQDLAHAFFCRDSSGRAVTDFGDGAIFGMNISKLVNSVRGGMLTLRDRTLAQRVRDLHRSESTERFSWKSRAYAFAAALAFSDFGYEVTHFLSQRTNLLAGETDYYDENRIEMPSDFAAQMTHFEAEIGLRSLARFDDRVEKRRWLADAYSEALAELPVSLPANVRGSTWSHFPILVASPVREPLRASLQRELRAEIGTIVDYAVSDLAAYQRRLAQPCAEASETARRVLNLPLTPFEGLFANGRPAAAKRLAERLQRCIRESMRPAFATAETLST